MFNKEINFSDIIEYFNKNNIKSFDEKIDEFGGFFITAARIMAVIIAPDPLSKIAVFCAGIDAASIRASKLLNWLPENFKYSKRGRELDSIKRFEVASNINYMLMHLALKDSVKEELMPWFSNILKGLDVINLEKYQIEAEALCLDYDNKREKQKINTSQPISNKDIEIQIDFLLHPILTIIKKEIERLENNEQNELIQSINYQSFIETFIYKTLLKYQAFLISFSGEFPEFGLWVDTTSKLKLLDIFSNLEIQNISSLKIIHNDFIKNTTHLIQKIDELNNQKFIYENGLPTFMDLYRELYKSEENQLTRILSSKTIENINAHHNFIKTELSKQLSDDASVDQIKYPHNNDIYISQSFEAINYSKIKHKKGFLNLDSLVEGSEIGENIGNYILKTLVDSNYAYRPIIILGNPGAGKSMFSKILAGILCETTDFIPFLIKLRSVASNSTNISDHINIGLQHSIINSSNINWLEWAKEFKNRIPVIIMDGFDELMQTSNRELNSYVEYIKDFQEKAIYNGVFVRVILTSRISVMQDVSIPEFTKIIKLNSFDEKRRNLWIDKWNNFQIKKGYHFNLPNNKNIELLASEPLLLFMLAIYDFENEELQKITNDKDFNQSKLYDSLLDKFIIRQLSKSDGFRNAKSEKKEDEKENFRLRLGMIALMMFLNDTTSRDNNLINNDLSQVGLNKSILQNENILGNFFFIHENKSIKDNDFEKLNYEFLHKTFGEFLAADFLLRVAKKQIDRILNGDRNLISSKECFNLCFGYNWLSKHHNIQHFLFEHANQIIQSESKESETLINLIKQDLGDLFNKQIKEFPVTSFRLMDNKLVIDHLGIYSQNIIFLWLAINKKFKSILFDIYDLDYPLVEPVSLPKYEAQDRDTLNKNKLLWKRIAKLWTLVGNNNTTAKLAEWINVEETSDSILLRKVKVGINHNFSIAATVACNDFEFLLSLFDKENKFTNDINLLRKLDKITLYKPELIQLAIDAIIFRLHDAYKLEGIKIIQWLIENDVNQNQLIDLYKQINQLKWQTNHEELIAITILINNKIPSISWESLNLKIEFLKTLIFLVKYFSHSELVQSDNLYHSFLKFQINIEDQQKRNSIKYFEFLSLLIDLINYLPNYQKSVYNYTHDSIIQSIKNIKFLIGKNYLVALDYLHLFNDNKLNYYFKYGYRELYSELIEIVTIKEAYLYDKNPQIILKNLKLLHVIYKEVSDDKIHSIEESIFQIFEYITKNYDNRYRTPNFNIIEYLLIVSDFGKTNSISKFFTQNIIIDAFHRISIELEKLTLHNPLTTINYFEVLKIIFNHYPNKNRFTEKLVLEPINKILQEKVKITNPESLLIYLELLLLNPKENSTDEILKLTDNLINRLKSLDNSPKLIINAAIILIQNDAPIILFNNLLKDHTALFEIFTRNPTFVKEVMMVTSKYYNNGKIN
jgi:energy-coupling factor transporter ATP-binding protein EcfA2